MHFQEFRTQLSYDAIPRIQVHEIQLLWCSDYWDGPQSGMLIYNNKCHRFETVAENEEEAPTPWFRRYAVLALSPEQLAKEQEVQEAFEKHVGTFRLDGFQRIPVDLNPREEWHFFYDKYLEFCENSKRYDENKVVAWFEK